jgi:hypothetical protein
MESRTCSLPVDHQSSRFLWRGAFSGQRSVAYASEDFSFQICTRVTG